MKEYFLGEIKMFSFNFVPRDFMECDGRLISIQENTALYSLLGDKYGGDSRTVFGLPSMKGDKNMKYCICIFGVYPSRHSQ